MCENSSFLPIVPDGVEVRLIPGFPGYAATTSGQVWTRRRNMATWKQMIPSLRGRYLGVSIRTDDGRQKNFTVHRLILLTFVGPRRQGMQSRHGLGGSLDNSLKNLCYGTKLENEADKVIHGKRRPPDLFPGVRRTKLSDETVAFIIEKLKGRPHRNDSKGLAKEVGVSIVTLQRAVRWHRLTNGDISKNQATHIDESLNESSTAQANTSKD